MTISIQEKYKQERERRLNAKGLNQYLDSSNSAAYTLGNDQWVERGVPLHRPVPNGGHCKIAIFGAGFGGLCAAVRFLQQGAAKSVDDILIIDSAGGFGGTWWWNRYPGLMCDVESYIYLPMLEETGYMPKRKYAGGLEIRQYADLIADQYELRDRGMFQTTGKSLTWKANRWEVGVVEHPAGMPETNINITADYVILASGGFTYPKIPDLPGIESFKGKMCHTARWDYSLTGGTQMNPVLSGLEGKKVAIVGTGATAIQVVPELAKYAAELNVFQRTPSAVDVRGNRDTDPEEWKTKIAAKKGWQNERAENFQAFTENVDILPKENLINDGMATMPTISGAFGGPSTTKLEYVGDYVAKMHELDYPRSERVRQRAAEVVKDPETAQNLMAYYPGWCKRPCFHDEYLQAFNRPSVHLVDTAGKGVEAMSANGILSAGKEYPVDIIIWSTGYGSPLTESLAGKAGLTVTGKAGPQMEERFKQGDLMQLHGCISHDFPNLFSTGLAQAGVGVNQTQRLDAMSIHISYIIAEAERRTGGKKTVIEPTQAACEAWGDQVASHAHLLATMGGCTPSYFTREGEADKMSPEQQQKAARNALWGQGYAAYAKVISDWRKEGGLQGIEVSSAN